MKPAGKAKCKSKLVVTFDAEKRAEYLLGFCKRKQERRRFGLDMQAYKDKKQQLALRKEKRANQMVTLGQVRGDEKETIAKCNLPTAPQVVQFDEPHTKDRFGSVVTVVTSLDAIHSDHDELDEQDLQDLAAIKKRKGNDTQPRSLFQQIQYKRRGIALPSKKAKLKEARRNRNYAGKKGAKFGPQSRVNEDSKESVHGKSKGFKAPGKKKRKR
uniref:Uncharacterized protein AlNc14C52G4048 n=1 Tax=Albugo laibachii Nc14 TaxID=890382 RepID=F0WBK3_9STRA|nr:conserved hypothetical protein [Albugo laibachii Nc14]|eukprot:CCA18530.1 conserved hypothetical protein [Albugo laibachii Nc14]